MCGIVGYIGEKQSSTFLTHGLSRLEYRGYDSAGIAVLSEDGELRYQKAKGRLARLEETLEKEPITGTIGIGHTRWATHGEPSFINAHPQMDNKEQFAVVHNGIIENYAQLRDMLIGEGYSFKSETDTEVVANLIAHSYKGDFLKAVLNTVAQLRGSYALGILSKENPDCIIGVRKDSPLIAGINEKEKEFYLASDIPAILSSTRDVYLLDDNELCMLTKEGITFFDTAGKPVAKDIYHVTWDAASSEKGGYAHFMLKEIMEQPKVVADTMKSRLYADQPVTLDTITITKEDLASINQVYIVACGTAYHAGLVGKTAIEKLAKIPVHCDIASEFRYRDPLIDEHSLMIVLSQSGETADTLAAMKLAKKKGARIIAITNVVGSTISREANEVLYTWAGPEIAVASTKAYTTQLIALYMIGIHFGETLGTADTALLTQLKKELLELPEKIQEILDHTGEIEKLAKKIAKTEDLFFIGRGLDFCVAMEGSLKLKEISYIHCEAYGAGELKHGPIALIEPGTFIIALATQDHLHEKMASNIKEVKARGANVITFLSGDNNVCKKESDNWIPLPEVNSFLAPVTSVIPLQLFAYYTSVAKGCDVDKPRNLAKSVTVE